MLTNTLIEILKTVVLVAIFFVWVIRYDNIVKEFISYGYPEWLRDLVGIFKLSFAVMLMSHNVEVVQVGSIGIALLMTGALVTHLRCKSPVFKMLPSFSLFCASVLIASFQH